ncbi:glutamine-rich protein 2-like isoform X5 [Manacus candei]|uniref:glutamine-rich protein 2-like isoform X5 n=1 Tax=Manacus candei TaxID=415023 RepID=UPI00222628B3|nr:glutamine-rich protein 2-like isoform X5 [Manacus candei]
MATPLDTLSLSQLLDLAIGMPQSGAIHFAAMRKLLQAVLGHLDMQYLTAQEPWTGELSGPSLAELAADVKQMKQDMESYKKLMSEEISGIKAEHSQVSKDIRKILEMQSHMAEDIKRLQEEYYQFMADYQNLCEEIGMIKTTQSNMAEKMRETFAWMKKMEDDMRKLREDAVKWKEEISEQITQQVESVLQETKIELKKMEEQQEMRNVMLEEMVNEATNQMTEATNQMNAQLGELGEITGALQEETEMEEPECSNCTFNIRVFLRELVKCCEKLKEDVDSLQSRQTAVGKVENIIKQRSQDQQLLQHMEDKVRKIQGDCEELSLVSGNLQKDCEEKQKAIEVLFQSLEKLQKEKADEQKMLQNMLTAMDVKADKNALGSKVNCTQFEANMERLDQRLRKMQSQVLGQNEHWNELQEKLSHRIENKLDRGELKAFHEKMEETWKKSIRELEKKMMADSAAGLRKQLPVPFTCLSCDRPVKTQVPGPYPETLPYFQPMPPSKDPQPTQRRTVASGRIARVLQSTGDHQRISHLVQRVQASPWNNTRPQGLTAPPNKPSVTKLLGSSSHTSKGQKDQPPVVNRAQGEMGPSTSQEQRPAKTCKPKHVSWAPELVQTPLPC